MSATCISVIDESSPSITTTTNDWNNFKANYPLRTFWVLDPGGGGGIPIPTAYANDPLANGPVTVNRDNGVVSSRSDWFAICRLNLLTPGSVVSLAVDTSGSMTLNTVIASYNLFIQRCNTAGLVLVVDTTFPDERWIVPHNKALPPSVSFTTSTTDIPYGNSATLSWNVTGEITTISINQGIGTVASVGSRTVSPLTTTTYTLTATGAGGTTTRSITINVIPPPIPVITFTASPDAIVRGETSTLTWSVTGLGISSITLTGFGSVTNTGSRTVSPTTTTTYTLTATNPGGTTFRSITLSVYIPPETLLTLDNATIIRGQCTFLRWTTTGDAGSATISPGIGSVNINGNRQICPTETTTYTINVSGLGGTDSDTITLIVYQPPTVNLNGPASLNYGQQGTLTYQATDTDISLQIIPVYTYKNTSVFGDVISLSTGQNVSGTLNTVIPYNDFGPVSVKYIMNGAGNGGAESLEIIIPINVDETPGNILVPESEDLLKSQNPIYTPDSTVTSYEILIEDIDIPVEIKADRPILVEVNDQQIWNPIRSIQ
jgi:hypothetical protein